MSGKLWVRQQRWLGLILILHASPSKHHVLVLLVCFCWGVLIILFFSLLSSRGFLSHTFSCFMLFPFNWTTGVTNLHREKGIWQTNVMSWYDFVFICSKCVEICVFASMRQVVQHVQTWSLKEENTSKVFFVLFLNKDKAGLHVRENHLYLSSRSGVVYLPLASSFGSAVNSNPKEFLTEAETSTCHDH